MICQKIKVPSAAQPSCAVKKNGKTAVAGDGQVTMGEHTIMKAGAKKVCRIYNGKVVVGFAGSVADAFALSRKIRGVPGAVCRQSAPSRGGAGLSNWRQDKAARQLEAMLLCRRP